MLRFRRRTRFSREFWSMVGDETTGTCFPHYPRRALRRKTINSRFCERAPLVLLQELLKVDAHATLGVVDPSTGLFPFCVAASRDYDLEVIYSLLVANPQVIGNLHSWSRIFESNGLAIARLLLDGIGPSQLTVIGLVILVIRRKKLIFIEKKKIWYQIRCCCKNSVVFTTSKVESWGP